MGVSEIMSGGKSNPHTHDDAEEVFYVVSGNGKMIVGDDEEEIGIGSCVFIPLGKRHQIINTSDEILKILAVTVPPFKIEKFDAVHLKNE
jgi:mannose-6-phosphate isomerase-like protein (cupin superfamily)